MHLTEGDHIKPYDPVIYDDAFFEEHKSDKGLARCFEFIKTGKMYPQVKWHAFKKWEEDKRRVIRELNDVAMDEFRQKLREFEKLEKKQRAKQAKRERKGLMKNRRKAKEAVSFF